MVQGIENGSASLLDEAGELHAYYHTDYLGTTDYLTSAVNSKVISWTYYNEWGEITHNAVLNCGARELDLVKLYATHDFDAVLTQYYAKARFYDVDNRRFTAVDPILDPSQYDISEYANDPMQLVQYLYVGNNAVNWIDPTGLLKINGINIAGAISGADVTGFSNDNDIYINLGDFEGLMLKYNYVRDNPSHRIRGLNSDIYAQHMMPLSSTKRQFTAIYRNINTGDKINVSISTTKINAATPLYFMKLSCAEDVLKNQLHLRVSTTDKSNIFRGSDYTKQAAVEMANNLADYVLFNGSYDPKYYFSNPTSYYAASALWWSKLAARNDTWTYATSGSFYEDVLGTGVGFISNYQQVRAAVGPGVPPSYIAAAAAFLSLTVDKEYVDFTDVRPQVAANLGKLIDDKLLSKRGTDAYNSVKAYLTIENSDLRYYLYESMISKNGFIHSHSGIQEQFNQEITTSQLNYVKNLGAYSYFIPSYINAFNERMNTIKSVNSEGFSISIPVISDADIASEMAYILSYGSNDLNF